MKNSLHYLLAFLLLFSIFAVPLIDTDFGWHFRCGQQIIEEGKLCNINTFTTLLPGYHWNSPSQGYQILIYLLYRLGGFPLISIIFGLSAAAVFLFFLDAFKGGRQLKLLLFLPGLWLAWLVFGLGLRSQILSVYFFALYLALIELSQDQPKMLWWTIPLMLLWSNSHPGFFLGIVLSLFLIVEQVLKILARKMKSTELKITLGVVLTNLAATVITPLGLGIYQEAWRHFQVHLNTLIVEWLPPFPWQRNLILAATAILIPTILVWGQRKALRLMVLVLCTYLAFEARRSLPLFTLGLTFSLFDRSLIEKIEGLFRTIFSRELLALIFISVFLYNFRQNVLPIFSFSEREYCQKALVTMPCGAVEFLKSEKSANVFNAYEWGGFLERQLPKFKFFVDGRMPTWDTSHEENLPVSWRGKSPYTVYLEITQTQPGWDQILRNYQTRYLLITPGNALDILLRGNPAKYGFENVYKDRISVVYRFK